MENLKNCTLCPRNCKIDRTLSTGFCGAGENVKIARAALHHWEEPCISGKTGSGTVFFSSCNLKCVYCQNFEISQQHFGKEITINRLAEIFLELESQGAHNINLVTPTPYVPQICEAIDLVRKKIKIPFVYNSSGYESVMTLRLLKDYIDIYLVDIKYKSPHLSKKYSAAKDYFEIAISALCEMLRQTGAPVFSGSGIMTRGTIVRHLVLPSCRQDSLDILSYLAENFGTDQFLLSIMSQYTPNENLSSFPEINRILTTFEYESVTSFALDLGFTSALVQSRQSANKKYTPPFDLSGV
ncbi:MAG: radical SAM protein [Clostridia bacterium]|nr:radical SAM protein [Clostridia bacterium]